MAIKEIKKWVVDDHAEFDTLHEAQKHENMKEYQRNFEDSVSYFFHDYVQLEDAHELKAYLEKNKDWILAMMDWAELYIDISKEG